MACYVFIVDPLFGESRVCGGALVLQEKESLPADHARDLRPAGWNWKEARAPASLEGVAEEEG